MNRYEKIKYSIILFFVNLFRNKENNFASVNSFFILGSGRNGSTLLASILNSHKSLFIPPEQFVLPYAIMKRYLFFFWSFDKWSNNVFSTLNKKNQTLNWDINFEINSLKSKNIFSLFDSIIRKYAKQKNKQILIWGDKTPLNTHFIPFIYPEFSDSKYIFLVRDPRDVVLSYKKLTKHKAVNTKYAIWKWKDSINQLRFLQCKTDVLVVKYEHLVNSSNDEVNRILEFIGLMKNENLVNLKNNAESMGVGTKYHHQNLNKPISNKSVGKWKEELSKEDIDLIEEECGFLMKDFKY